MKQFINKPRHPQSNWDKGFNDARKEFYKITFRVDGVKWPITRLVRRQYYLKAGEIFTRVCRDGSDWEKETKDKIIKEVYILKPIKMVPLFLNRFYAELEEDTPENRKAELEKLK